MHTVGIHHYGCHQMEVYTEGAVQSRVYCAQSATTVFVICVLLRPPSLCVVATSGECPPCPPALAPVVPAALPTQRYIIYTYAALPTQRHISHLILHHLH